MSVFEVYDVYKFPKKPFVKFPQFQETHTFWSTIGDDMEYVGSTAKKLLRNPVLRYIFKLMGNTFFTRKEINVLKIMNLISSSKE